MPTKTALARARSWEWVELQDIEDVASLIDEVDLLLGVEAERERVRKIWDIVFEVPEVDDGD